VINEKFVEAREEIEYAREDAETVRGRVVEKGWLLVAAAVCCCRLYSTAK
jgi:hypothetical protein